MKWAASKIIGAFFIVIILIIASFAAVTVNKKRNNKENPDKTPILQTGVKCLIKTFNFSEPVINENDDLFTIEIKETDFHSMGDGRPVLPVNLTTVVLPFGTKIVEFEYEYTTPKIISLFRKISYASCSTLTKKDNNIYKSNESYPSEFVSYHTGGGLLDNQHKTFLNIRVNPVIYYPWYDEIHFIDKVKIKVFYIEPEEPILEKIDRYDFLIISPKKFTRNLQPLVAHKESKNIKTKLTTVEEINKIKDGRDTPEKIKYYIKNSIEELGIDSVLLVGGRDGQFLRWNLPVRYSHVIIREGTQELIEPEFISDLYYADIYDSEGNFSSWDTNQNDIFAEFNEETEDKMDLYPDVKLGRLACRNNLEVRTVVDKIINYENGGKQDWFDKMILISGDHWNDKEHIIEGELIMDAAAELMANFTPVKIYASRQKINFLTINQALNKGAGFAYFSGHGSITLWGIRYPPDASQWTGFYKTRHMNLLRNKYKLPVTVVGGCNNGQFDVSLIKIIKDGIKSNGLRYLLFKFWFRIIANGLITNCWAWKLTSKRGGGSIATIANTGLGTHAMDDSDYNNINDYLEAYDGWLELKFFELYSQENIKNLGQLHQEAITYYLNTFLGNYDEMDTKMAQQWQLFGDPTLMIGGY